MSVAKNGSMIDGSADGKVEFEVRADLSKLDGDLEKSKQIIVKSTKGTAEEQEKQEKKQLESSKKINSEKVNAIEEVNKKVQQNAEKSQKKITETAKSEGEKVVKSEQKNSKEIVDDTSETAEKIKKKFKETSEEFEDDFEKSSKNSGEHIKSIKDKALSAANAIGKAFAAIITVSAAAGTAAIKSAADAESSFAKVKTMLSANSSAGDFYDELMNVSNATGVEFGSLSEGLYQALSAGVQEDKAVEFVQSSVSLAKGGFTEIATAIDVVTTAINAYGLSIDKAQHIQDVLITTQNKGKTTVDELASSMGQIIPTANSLNVSLDQLGAMYATVTANGVATAESTTYMNSMLNEFASSSSVASKALAEAAEGTEMAGKTFSQLTNEGYTVAEILTKINDNAKKSGKSLVDMFGSSEAAKAAQILVDNSGKFAENLDAMANSAGAAESAAATMMDTLNEKINKLIANAKNMLTEFGNVLMPFVAEAVDAISANLPKIEEIFNGFAPLIGEMMQQIIELITDILPELLSAIKPILDLVVGVFLPAMVNLIKFIVQFKEAILAAVVALTAYKAAVAGLAIIAKVRNALQGATAAQYALNTAMSLNPVGLVIAAIAVFVTTLVGLINTSGEAGKAIDELNESMDNLAHKYDDEKANIAAENEVIKDKVARYDELRNSLDLTAAEMTELQGLASNLQSIFGDSVSVIDAETGAYNDLNAALTTYIANKETQLKQKIAEENAEEALKNMERIEKEIEKLDNRSLNAYGNSDYRNFGAFGYLKWSLDYEPQLQELKNLYAENEKLYQESLDAMAEAYSESEKNRQQKEQERIKQEQEQLKLEIESAEAAAKKYENIFESVEDAAANLTTKFNALKSAQDEVAAAGNLSVATLKNLAAAYPVLQDKINEYISGAITEKELLNDLANAYNTDQDNYYRYLLTKQGYQQDYIDIALANDDELVKYFAENYEIDLSNYKDYISRKQAIQAAYDSYVAGGISAYWTQENGYTNEFLSLNDHTKGEISGIISEYQQAMSDIGIQADFAKMKQRTLQFTTLDKSNNIATTTNDKAGSDSAAETDKITTSGGTSGNTPSGVSGNNLISITSYVPTVWDNKNVKNKKLSQSGAISNIGGMAVGRLISGKVNSAEDNVSKISSAGGTTLAYEATLSDVVKAVNELKTANEKVNLTLNATLKTDNMTLAKCTCQGIKDIEKSTGKSPLE